MILLTGDLYSFLVRDAAIGAAIGARCYPTILPQAPTYPALTYQEISATRVRDTLGPAGKVRRRIQIDAWAMTHVEAISLGELVRDALDGFRGMMGSTEVGSTILVNELEVFEQEAGTVGIYRLSQDYQIGHLEA